MRLLLTSVAIKNTSIRNALVDLVLQPHLGGGASGCVVAAAGAGLVAASPA